MHLGIVEYDRTDAVALAQYAPTAEGRELGGGHGFHAGLAAEEHRQTLVDQQQDGAVALLVTPREEDPQIVVPVADVPAFMIPRSSASVTTEPSDHFRFLPTVAPSVASESTKMRRF